MISRRMFGQLMAGVSAAAVALMKSPPAMGKTAAVDRALPYLKDVAKPGDIYYRMGKGTLSVMQPDGIWYDLGEVGDCTITTRELDVIARGSFEVDAKTLEKYGPDLLEQINRHG